MSDLALALALCVLKVVGCLEFSQRRGHSSLYQRLAPSQPKRYTSQDFSGGTIGRLQALFGSGWFFEWPGGRHPLNTTWPWADVKPSLLVLWGVCWMFVITPDVDISIASRDPYRPDYYFDKRLISNGMFYSRSITDMAGPVIKIEAGSEYVNHTMARRDYRGSKTMGTGLFPPPPVDRQPIHAILQSQAHDQGPPIARRLQVQLQQADAPWNRTSVTPAMSAEGEGCYLGFFSDTNTNGILGPGTYGTIPRQVNTKYDNANADAKARYHYPLLSELSPQATRPPHLSTLTTSSNHNDPNSPNPTQSQASNQRYYESSRHSSREHYLRSVAASSTSTFDTSSLSYYNPDAMSLSYESRTFPDYPQSAMMHDPHQEQDDNSMQHHRYPSPPPPLNENPYNPQSMDATGGLTLDEMPELPTSKEEEDAPSPGRSKPIPKPDREVTKGDDGRFVCTWVGCTEDVRSFNRKCEWSKHMDKHDRPYKCPSEGCEKLPGFTYSGGLLRHQREVHNLHGGPRKQLNCPHPNCKRFSGKGFSRQENLNEHLRRVHTDAGDLQNGEETEDEGSERVGMKRKRGRDDSVDLRQEMARLRNENEELRRQAELQTSQTNELMRQLQNLQNLVGTRIQQVTAHQAHQAPQATMM